MENHPAAPLLWEDDHEKLHRLVCFTLTYAGLVHRA